MHTAAPSREHLIIARASSPNTIMSSAEAGSSDPRTTWFPEVICSLRRYIACFMIRAVPLGAVVKTKLDARHTPLPMKGLFYVLNQSLTPHLGPAGYQSPLPLK